MSFRAIRWEGGPANTFYLACRKSFSFSEKSFQNHSLPIAYSGQWPTDSWLTCDWSLIYVWLSLMFPISLVTPLLQISLVPWFSMQGDFPPSLQPRDVWKCLEAVLMVSTGRRRPLARRGGAKYGTKHSKRLRTAPHPQQKWSALKCQQCGSWETLLPTALLGEVSGGVENETGFRNMMLGLTKRLGLGAGVGGSQGAELYNVPRSFYSRVLTFGVLSPSFIDNQELAACGLAQCRLS